jgi:hypothetical protein
MKLTQTPTADLREGDVVYREGDRIVIEVVRQQPAREHRSAFWVINGHLYVGLDHVWTREERP